MDCALTQWSVRRTELRSNHKLRLSSPLPSAHYTTAVPSTNPLSAVAFSRCCPLYPPRQRPLRPPCVTSTRRHPPSPHSTDSIRRHCLHLHLSPPAPPRPPSPTPPPPVPSPCCPLNQLQTSQLANTASSWCCARPNLPFPCLTRWRSPPVSSTSHLLHPASCVHLLSAPELLPTYTPSLPPASFPAALSFTTLLHPFSYCVS